MSGSRQRVTGNLQVYFLIWIALVVALWWLPGWILRWFPQLSLPRPEPWMMNPDDLNWKRVLVNMVTKPGFRLVTATVAGVVCVVIKKIMGLSLRGKDLPTGILRWSTEWSVEGRGQSFLLEYGRWIGAVR